LSHPDLMSWSCKLCPHFHCWSCWPATASHPIVIVDRS
jgi:hypothetical protein